VILGYNYLEFMEYYIAYITFSDQMIAI